MTSRSPTNPNPNLKTIAECDITLPLVDLVDFRYVLMNTFQSAQTEIANLKSSLRLIISGSPHSRSTDMRQGEKKGGHQSKPVQPLCTVWGKFSHDSKACPAKGSPYANLTPSAFVGFASHAKLVADKGPRNYCGQAVEELFGHSELSTIFCAQSFYHC